MLELRNQTKQFSPGLCTASAPNSQKKHSLFNEAPDCEWRSKAHCSQFCSAYQPRFLPRFASFFLRKGTPLITRVLNKDFKELWWRRRRRRRRRNLSTIWGQERPGNFSVWCLGQLVFWSVNHTIRVACRGAGAGTRVNYMGHLSRRQQTTFTCLLCAQIPTRNMSIRP